MTPARDPSLTDCELLAAKDAAIATLKDDLAEALMQRNRAEARVEELEVVREKEDAVVKAEEV